MGDETWRAHAATATVALQLRGFDRGESSATIAHCMATVLPGDADAKTIGDALVALLDDPPRRTALADAGRAFRRDRQPADAARALGCPQASTRRGTS